MSRNNLTYDKLISKCCGEVSYKIGSDWLQWGRFLGLSDSDLNNIGSDNVKCYEKADNVFKKWKQMNGNSSWEQLKKELVAFRRPDIVVEIEKEYGDSLSYPENSRYEVISFDLFKQARNEYKKGISEICSALKNYYLENYEKVIEIHPPLKVPESVDLIHKFVDLCIVDAVKTQMNAVCNVERKEFLEKQMSYTPIPYSEIFMKEKSVLLISGIAGIGKTWLLRKCLLDWSKNLIWKNVELVFYLEYRRLNQYQNISNINELLNVFYKDILNDFNIHNHTVMFLIDGLDEFKYLDELINHTLTCNYPIVKTLVEIQKYKHVVAGRVYAIDKYQSISTEHNDKLTIQVMGFNQYGINDYIENNVTEEKKEVVKTTLKESSIAKAMASVPFYLSSMCKIISDSKELNQNSFLTMTDLYANIFLYFLQKHIIKNNELIYQIMENDSNKTYVLNICKIAYQLFVENKVIFSKEEIQSFISDLDKNEGNLFGFIERIETNFGHHYQFAHLTIMEFCASVYAYNCLSSEEIMANRMLRNCLSMICGLTNKNQNSLFKFLTNLNPSKKSYEEFLPLFCKLGLLRKSYNNFNEYEFPLQIYYSNLFIECFYESQSPLTDDIKLTIDKQREWIISIHNGKTSYETSCCNYFVNHLIKSGRKLTTLSIDKNIFSDEEKHLLILCSSNVRYVTLFRPIKIEGWKPKDKIDLLSIYIPDNLSKKDFENFLPWINLCEGLDLSLHDDINYIEDIYEWVRRSNIKEFKIAYRKNYFHNLDEFKSFITQKKCLIS
ncbi:NACHT, LRR and PYD domains-containing protein 9 [Hydra vulgaris]|uniref:NACHT, LRR and PYD domains-containing protein 9 n=1 Tax=Hydra vulgaris TaxID=6087 RepID=UPI001F5FEE03|nr:NACHT, LRR and PYD domains-containing protein 9 [Hydra vulgaris]